MGEEPLFGGKAASVAGEVSGCADHAVARHDDGDGVPVVGQAHRAGCVSSFGLHGKRSRDPIMVSDWSAE